MLSEDVLFIQSKKNEKNFFQLTDNNGTSSLVLKIPENMLASMHKLLPNFVKTFGGFDSAM